MDTTKAFFVLPGAPSETFLENLFDWWGNDDGTRMAGDRQELLERFRERPGDFFSGAYRGLTVEVGVHDGSGAADGIPAALDDYPLVTVGTETSTQFEHDGQFRGSEAAANVERLLELVRRLYAFCCTEDNDPEYVVGFDPGSLQALYDRGVEFTPEDLSDVDSDLFRQIHNRYTESGQEYPDSGLTNGQRKELLETAFKRTEETGESDVDYRREIFDVRPHRNGNSLSDKAIPETRSVDPEYHGSDISRLADRSIHVKLDDAAARQFEPTDSGGAGALSPHSDQPTAAGPKIRPRRVPDSFPAPTSELAHSVSERDLERVADRSIDTDLESTAPKRDEPTVSDDPGSRVVHGSESRLRAGREVGQLSPRPARDRTTGFITLTA
jgi:hypothetical protein